MKTKQSNKFLPIIVFSLSALIVSVLPAAAQSASQLYRNGIEDQNNEDWYSASQNFLEATHANPVYGDAWFHLSQCTYQLGQYDLALKYLENAEKYTKDSSAVLNLRGLCFISLGKLNQAKEQFNAVLRTYPNDVDARFGLAELELYDGRIAGAQQQFSEALKRDTTNRKALLSLSLVSAQQGNTSAADMYMQQAMRYYSGEAEVHYLAACLCAMRGDFTGAEKRARSAVEINGNYDRAYSLLASVLYFEGRFSDVIDICDFRIGRDRSLASAWYLKGLSQYRLGNISGAISTWTTGLEIDPLDEVMRSALEQLVDENIALEDTRRSAWASYHIKNAHEYAKRYDDAGAGYEYQRALKVDPSNKEARLAYANLLNLSGLHELYLEQLKFLKDNTADEQKTASSVKMNDEIEAYDSILQDSLAKKWNVRPFYLDKTRWKIGVYYTSSQVQLVHADCARITAAAAASLFAGVATTSVETLSNAVNGYGDAYRRARTDGVDYFVIVTPDEGIRDITLNAVMYSGRTGTESGKMSFYSTGNNRYSSVLRRLRAFILEKLPVRGKIIDRSGNDILVDLGKSEGIRNGAVLNIVRKGGLYTADTGTGLTYLNSDIYGTLTVSQTGEEISQGVLSGKGFYDRVNTGDEVVLVALPKQMSAQTAQGDTQNVVPETAPRADASGKAVVSSAEKKKLITEQDFGSRRNPAFIDLIRSVY